MDPDLILIFGFTLAALWIIFRRPRLRPPHLRQPHRDRRYPEGGPERRPAEDEEVASRELLEQLARLEERVKVLERIVTDDPRELRKQFRDLAD